jgi:hypothetical protein
MDVQTSIEYSRQTKIKKDTEKERETYLQTKRTDRQTNRLTERECNVCFIESGGITSEHYSGDTQCKEKFYLLGEKKTFILECLSLALPFHQLFLFCALITQWLNTRLLILKMVGLNPTGTERENWKNL